MGFVQTYVENKWPDESMEERQQVERELEVWAASEKRDIQEKWEPMQVAEAAERIVEIKGSPPWNCCNPNHLRKWRSVL